MMVRVNKVRYFFDSRVYTLNTHDQGYGKQLHHPLRCGYMKVKPRDGSEKAYDKLYLDTGFRSEQKQGTPGRIADTF